MEHYLDNASTTKMCTEAIEQANFIMNEVYGNPSSTHTLGRKAKEYLENYRKDISSVLYCKENELYFTSCGTESDNWAIKSSAILKKREGKHIISSLVEHDAVRESLNFLENNGYEITRLKPDSTGRVSVDDVKNNLRDDTILVSLMMVNNETGAVNDIKGISEVVKDYNSNILVHTDAVQGFKKINFKAKSLGADMISISAHKIHAMKGIGALYISEKVKLPVFMNGGHQEREKRAGTEALVQIASFAAACKIDPEIEKIKELKNLLVKKLNETLPEVQIVKTDAPHILSISLPKYKSEVLMNFLEEREIYVSKSSACRVGKRSHVLEAMNLSNEIIDGSIRIGLSRYNNLSDIDALVNGLVDAKKLIHS